MINAIHDPEAYKITGDQVKRAKYIVDSEDYANYTISGTRRESGRQKITNLATESTIKNHIATKATSEPKTTTTTDK